MIGKTNTQIALERRIFMQRAAVGTVGLSTTRLVYPNGDPIKQHQAQASDSPKQFYNDLRDSVLAGANLIPVVGGFLSYLGALFIPNSGESPEQMWRRLIDSKISDALMRLVQQNLVGLSNVSRLYKIAIETGNNASILAQSIAADTQFNAMLPGFKIKGEETALLPLFAIAATLHLALLRDIVLKGLEIGLSEAHVASYAKEMVSLIQQYSAHVDMHAPFAIEKARRENPHKSVGLAQNMPLSAMLIAKTDYQLRVYDLRDTWEGFDPIRFPGKSPIKLDREVYTPIIGWWGRKNGTPNAIPVWRHPSTPLTAIEGWDRAQWRTRFIFGFDLTYADGSVSNIGSRISNPHPVRVGNYIDRVKTLSSAGLFQMSFRNNEGRWTKVGRDREDVLDREFDSSFSGHQLSSIRSMGQGINAAEGAMSGCVLGFQLIHQSAARISPAALEEITPKIAPQLRKWIAG